MYNFFLLGRSVLSPKFLLIFFIPERNGKSILFTFIVFFISLFLSQSSRYQNRTSGGGVVIKILTRSDVFEYRYILNPKHAHNADRISVKPPVLGPFVVKTLGKNLPQYWQDRLQRSQILGIFTIFDLRFESEKKQSKRGNKKLRFSKVLRRSEPAAINLTIDVVFAAD